MFQLSWLVGEKDTAPGISNALALSGNEDECLLKGFELPVSERGSSVN